MTEYHARDLIAMSEDTLWSLDLSAPCTITFDDSVLVESKNTLTAILSSYYWRITSFYDEVPITSNIFIGDQLFTDRLHRELLKYAIDNAIKFNSIDREDVWEIVYRECYNGIYNAVVTRLTRFMTSIDDFAVNEILNHPKIKEANEKVQRGLIEVNDCYDVIRDVFASDELVHNPIVQDQRTGLVNINQLLQSFGPVGYVTEINSVLFKNPILRGFAMGLTELSDYAKYSRSASKAILFNKDPVAIAEYLNRKLQLVCNVIEEIVYGDCKTHHYNTISIAEGVTGIELLKSMHGLYQVLDDGSLKKIDANDKSLLGTTVNFRTTMSCRHLPNQKVCSTCYGEMSYAIARGTSPGHVSTTSLGKDASQKIISTKHLDFVVIKFAITLAGMMKKHFMSKKHIKELLYINKESCKGKHMLILKDEALRLSDINYMSAEPLNPMDLTELGNIEIGELIDDRIYNIDTMDLTMMSIKPSFTTMFLEYLAKHGWRSYGNKYLIDLSGWDHKLPILIYPDRHVNMRDFVGEVEKFIRNGRGQAYPTTSEALLAFHNLVSQQIKGKYLGHLATILAAGRVVSEQDYNLPFGEDGRFISHDKIIRNRSLGAAMLYESQEDAITDIRSYIYRDRPGSLLDDAIKVD